MSVSVCPFVQNLCSHTDIRCLTSLKCWKDIHGLSKMILNKCSDILTFHFAQIFGRFFSQPTVWSITKDNKNEIPNFGFSRSIEDSS